MKGSWQLFLLKAFIKELFSKWTLFFGIATSIPLWYEDFIKKFPILSDYIQPYINKIFGITISAEAVRVYHYCFVTIILLFWIIIVIAKITCKQARDLVPKLIIQPKEGVGSILAYGKVVGKTHYITLRNPTSSILNNCLLKITGYTLVPTDDGEELSLTLNNGEIAKNIELHQHSAKDFECVAIYDQEHGGDIRFDGEIPYLLNPNSKYKEIIINFTAYSEIGIPVSNTFSYNLLA